MNESDRKKNIAKQELKKRIVLAAMKAFTTNGIKGVTMDDVASDLGISKRTLYETFKDKEELLIECVKLQEEEKETFGAKAIAESSNVLEVILKFYKLSIDIYQKINIRFFEDIRKYPKVNELIRQSREKNQCSVLAFFKSGVEQGIFRDDVNFEIVNILLREQMDFLHSAEIVRAYSFFEVYESIVFIFLRGISTEKGQKILDEFIGNYRKQKM
jgi:AcrR family transcriptional regulator